MAGRQVLEGPWEEVSRQVSGLAGKWVRIEVLENGHPGEDGPRLRAPSTPEERAQAFIAWGRSHPPRNAPPLSDEAISRDTIYGGQD